MRQTIRSLVVLLPWFFLAVPLDARIYQWVDDAGTVHYSTTPPPSTSDRELRTLDGRGQERRVRPAPPTEEEREQATRERERQQQEAEEQEREKARLQADKASLQARVRQLRQAYASVDEIREQRDRRVAMVANILALSERQEETLQRERERIAEQIEKAAPDSKNLERYQAELVDLERRLQREHASQDRQRAMLEEIRSTAEADIRDYELYVTPSRH